MHETHPPALPPLALAAIAAVLGALAPAVLGIAGVALAFAPIVVAALRRRGLDPACLAAPAALAAFVPTAAFASPNAAAPLQGPVRVSGIVQSRLIIDDLRGDARCVVARGPDRVLCVFEGGADLRPGDRIDAHASLALPGYASFGPALPVATVPEGGLRTVQRAHSLASLCESARLTMRRALVAQVRGREGRLLAQLVLGHGGEVDLDVADAHRATGLSHLLAVSGAHVSLLAGMLALLLRGRAERRAPAAVLLVLVGLYGTITGLDPPVVRALVGFALLLLAQRHGRRLPITAALAAPGLATALLWPQDARSASFALSYAAVAGLALAPSLRRPAGLGQRLWIAMAASAWATLTTAPLTLAWFGQLAPWTILATPLLGPLVALLLAGGLVLASCGALGTELPWLAQLLQITARGYLAAVEALATMPGAPVLAVSVPPLLAGAAFALLGGTALWHWPDRRGAAALCLALTAVHFVPWPSRAVAGLQLLAVGHGQCALLRWRDGRCVVVDCGSLQSPRRAADALSRALAPSRAVDLLVLTHGDADHTAGVAAALRRMRVARCALPSDMLESAVAHDLRRAGVPLTLVPPGSAVQPWPDLTLSRPEPAPRAPSNDRGLFVHADLGGCTALLPGDAGDVPVRAWVASPHAQRADVLVLPHHGRPHAAIGALVDAVRPRLALVSGGEPGRAAAQTETVRRRGAMVLETEHVGDITVEAGRPPRVRAGALPVLPPPR